MLQEEFPVTRRILTGVATGLFQGVWPFRDLSRVAVQAIVCSQSHLRPRRRIERGL